MQVYQHKLNGKFYRLTKKGEGNINTYIEVDKDNNPMVEWRSWAHKPQTQTAIIEGFENLTKL